MYFAVSRIYLKILTSEKYVSTIHPTKKVYDIRKQVNDILKNVSYIRKKIFDIDYK